MTGSGPRPLRDLDTVAPVNWRQFTVALVQALAWPSVALVVLLVYRRRVSQLLGDNLRRLTVGPIQAEWEQVAQEARATIEAADKLSEISDSADNRSVALLRAARTFIEFNPDEAIRFAWAAVVWAIDDYVDTGKFDLPSFRLRDANPGAAAVLERLRQLRDLAPHERTPEHAREYTDLVEDFLELLRKPIKPTRDRGEERVEGDLP